MTQNQNTINQEKARIQWIDGVKAVTIFLVVCLHIMLEIGAERGMGYSFVHLWHMPIFFVASGMTMNADKWNGRYCDFVKSRLFRLIAPYFVFGVFFSVLQYFVVNVLKVLGPEFGMSSLFWDMVFNNDEMILWCVEWFLTAMFVSQLLFVIVLKYDRPWLLFVVMILSAVVASVLFGIGIKMPFAILPGILGLSYMCFGRLVLMSMKRYNTVVLLGISMFVCLLVFVVSGKKSVTDIVYFMRNGNFDVASLIGSYLMSVVVLCCVKMIYDCIFEPGRFNVIQSLVSKIGQSTLAILVLNSAFIKVLGFVVIPDSVMVVFLLSSVFVGVMVYVGGLIHKYIPWTGI